MNAARARTAAERTGSGERARRIFFDRLYAASSDPYGLRVRWYESRKRALLLAALPRQRFGSGFEPGCGTGELSIELALRCDALLASDFSERAVHLARERTARLPHVRVERQTMPVDWPSAQQFDLIVLSELSYFLDAGSTERLARLCASSLLPQGILVACDWRADFDARTIASEDWHCRLHQLGLPRLARYEDADFLLTLWSADPISVAQREGIR